MSLAPGRVGHPGKEHNSNEKSDRLMAHRASGGVRTVMLALRYPVFGSFNTIRVPRLTDPGAGRGRPGRLARHRSRRDRVPRSP